MTTCKKVFYGKQNVLSHKTRFKNGVKAPRFMRFEVNDCWAMSSAEFQICMTKDETAGLTCFFSSKSDDRRGKPLSVNRRPAGPPQ